MTEKLKKKLVGLFVLGSFTILIIALMLFGSGTLFKESFRFVCYFPSSLNGLTSGSAVLFHGVRVGRVVNVYVITGHGHEEYSTPVVIEIDKDLMFQSNDKAFFSQEDANEIVRNQVERGLRARLGNRSMLTGQLSVELVIQEHIEETVDITNLNEYDGLLQIPTIVNPLEAIWQNLSAFPFNNLVAKFDSIANEVHNTLVILNSSLEGGRLSTLIDAYTELAQNANTQITNLGQLSTGVESLVASLTHATTSLDALMNGKDSDVSQFLAALTSLAEKGDILISELTVLMEEDSATMIELGRTMQSLQSASEAVTNLAGLLEIKPNALVFGK